MGYGHNKSILSDGNARLFVKSKGNNAPPGSPSAGDIYLTGTSPTGLWAGQASKLTIWNGSTGAWEFQDPPDGVLLFVDDESLEYVCTGGNLLSTAEDLVVSYATDANPYVSRGAGDSYASQGAIYFPGSNTLGIPAALKTICKATSASPAHSIRIYDVTNAKQICEKTGMTNTGISIVDMGAISNVPASEAVWEVQSKRDSAGGTSVHIYSVVVRFK